MFHLFFNFFVMNVPLNLCNRWFFVLNQKPRATNRIFLFASIWHHCVLYAHFLLMLWPLEWKSCNKDHLLCYSFLFTICSNWPASKSENGINVTKCECTHEFPNEIFISWKFWPCQLNTCIIMSDVQAFFMLTTTQSIFKNESIRIKYLFNSNQERRLLNDVDIFISSMNNE